MTLFLHGALGSAAQFDSLRAKLPESLAVHALHFPGHGGVPANSGFSMQLFADSVLDFLDQSDTAHADIFGYSMGGYVALWLAWQHPERVRSVLTYGTKLNWTPEVATGMSRMFDPEKIEAKAPALAESLAKTHGADLWKSLCRHTDGFLQDLGAGKGIPPEAFGEIQCPVTIGWGDQDNVVSESESREIAERIPRGRFEMLPGGRHLLEQVDVDQLAQFVVQNR